MLSSCSRTVLGCVLLAACSQPPVADSTAAATPAVNLEEARAAIAAANAAYNAGYLQNDAAAVAALYAEDAAELPAGEPTVVGRTAVDSRVRSAMDSTTTTAAASTTDELFAAGDYVVEIGTWSGSYTTKQSKATSEVGRYLVIWKRDSAGAWKIYREIANRVPAKK